MSAHTITLYTDYEADLTHCMSEFGLPASAMLETIILSALESHRAGRLMAEAKPAVDLKVEFDRAKPSDTKAEIEAAVEAKKPKEPKEPTSEPMVK